jgi:hypothetical protein
LEPITIGTPKVAGSNTLCTPVPKASTYISNIGITVDFGQNPNGVNDKNIKIG